MRSEHYRGYIGIMEKKMETTVRFSYILVLLHIQIISMLKLHRSTQCLSTKFLRPTAATRN